MGSVPLSVVILARNEAGRIRGCIESASWAAEVLVIDDGSTDDTVRLAESLGAKVLRRRMDIEGRHRNWAHDQAVHEWILSLDADERVTPELAEEIATLLRGSPERDNYDIPRRNHIGNRWIQYGGWYPSAQVKLFRRSTFRWEEAPVHPRAISTSTKPSGALTKDIVHYSYRDLADFIAKMDRQTTWEAEKWLADGRKIGLAKALRRGVDRFARAYWSKQGHRDGLWGLVLAVLAGLYQLISYAKYWERRRGVPVESLVEPFRPLIRDDERLDRSLLMSHLCAYRLAGMVSRDRKVLEIGSGGGYGAYYLSHIASEVLGIDFEAAVIKRATDLFYRPNLSFVHMNGTRLEFPDASFDVVGTFQVIEHIPEPQLEQFLREIARVLKPDGVLVLSTLNLDHNRKPGHPYEKPSFHEKEFTPPEFDELLRRVFPVVQVRGLYPNAGYRMMRRMKKWGMDRLGAPSWNPVQRFYTKGMGTDDHHLRPRCTPQAIDLIGFCALQPRAFPEALGVS